jgi:hypothetical protein
MTSQPTPLLGFLPILLLSIPLALVLYFLAERKGQNAPLYLLIGLIPLVNWLATVYLVGAPDLVLHAKIPADTFAGTHPKQAKRIIPVNEVQFQNCLSSNRSVA